MQFSTFTLKTVAECDELLKELASQLTVKQAKQQLLATTLRHMEMESQAVTSNIAFLTAEIERLERSVNLDQESSVSLVKLRKEMAKTKGDLAALKIKEALTKPEDFLRKQFELQVLESEISGTQEYMEAIARRKQELHSQAS